MANYCAHCGKRISNSEGSICSECLRASESTNYRRKDKSAPLLPADAPIGLEKREFLKTYSVGARNCVTAAGIGYATAAVSLIIFLTGIFYVSPIIFLDIGFVLFLALMIHMFRSRVASVFFLLYSVSSFVLGYLSYGYFTGVITVVGGVLAVIGSFKCAKEWREYLRFTESGYDRTRSYR